MDSLRWSCALVLVLGACGDARAPRCWVADRAAGAVLGLDAELCVVERLALVEPGLLGSDPDGLWAACALREGAAVPQRLARVERRSGAVTTSDCAVLVALSTDGRGSAFVLEHRAAREGSGGAGDTLLWRIARDHQRSLLGAFPSARALAARPDALLVGCSGGELVLVRADGAVLAFARGQGAVHALARGPRSQEWWSLEGNEERTLRLLDGNLAPVRSTRVAPGTTRFAPVEGMEHVWIAAEGRVARLGPDGADPGLELPAGPWEVAHATGSGVLLYGPGALLDVEVRHGVARVRRTQGGFALLVALVPD